MKKVSFSKFISNAKNSNNAKKCGMFLFHNGVVRESQKIKVRKLSSNKSINNKVEYMEFSYNKKLLAKYISAAKKMNGIYYVDVWLNEGKLKVGNDIMFVAIGGDIRPNVINCLETLVENIKSKCVNEIEILKE